MSNPDTSSVLQQEKTLLNPFDIKDEDILEKVYITHFHCIEKYDVDSLYYVASNVVNHSIEMSDMIIKSPNIDRLKEDTPSFPRLLALKRIACQMIFTPLGEQYAHQTTLLILEQLKAYSWDAKAVISLAAFALEYGKFWHLPLTPRDQLGNSLSLLNGVFQTIPENPHALAEFNRLVKRAMEMIECITEWRSLSTAGYDIKDVPALSDTLQEVPVVVYWVIMTFVTCTSHMGAMSDKDYKSDLSKFEARLTGIFGNFKTNVQKCDEQRGAIADYTRRKAIVTQSGRDIVKVLKALINPNYGQDSKQLVLYNSSNGEQQARIEEFRRKYVLLFLSGIHDIKDEVQLLRSIYEGLKESPKVVEGYKEDDFKILWIPIDDNWNDVQHKSMFQQVNKTGWYVVKEFNYSTGIRLIKEVFDYKDKSIIVLLNPEGKVENPDAKHIISVWGMDGFPFRSSDYKRLTQQWNWFWAQMKTLSPEIEEFTKKEDCYIFIYGGTDSKWVQNFRAAMEKLKSEETLVDIVLHPLVKDDPKIVPRFWIGIDSLLASKKQRKQGFDQEFLSDFATGHIKKLINLKRDPHGWVILSKGSNIKLMGQGETMYQTAKEFDVWKERFQKCEVSFDVAFKEYYERKVKDAVRRPKCEYREHGNYFTDIQARICPNPDCRRLMEVDSVKLRCCHEGKGVVHQDGATTTNSSA